MTPHHRSYSLLVRSKSRQKCPLFCQTFNTITVKTAVCFYPAASFLIYFQEVLFSMPFLLWSNVGISGPASFWQSTRTGSTYLLSSGPSTAGGHPCFTASVFFPSLSYIYHQLKINVHVATKQTLASEQSWPRRGALLVGCQSGSSIVDLGKYNLLCAKTCHPARFSLLEGVDSTAKCFKTHLFIHCYFLQALSTF